MKTEIDHFYWVRNRTDGIDGPAWHVQVFDVAETMDEVAAMDGQAKRARMLNMEQAIAAGFDLKTIAAEFTADAALRYEEALAAGRGLLVEFEKLMEEKSSLAAQLEAARQELARRPAQA